MGALHLLVPGYGGRPWPLLDIVMGGFLLAISLWDLLIRPRFDARRLRRYEADLTRLASGGDTHPDELRAMLANPPLIMPLRRQLLFTAVFTLFGGAFLALGLSHPQIDRTE